MTALTDALDWWERKARPPTGGFARLGDWRYLHVLAAVARRVADAPEVWWCEEHSAATHPPGPELRCDVWVVAGCEDFLLAEPCRMVRILLVSPVTRPRGRHARQEDQWKD